jgi:hypothetical protein
LHAIGAQDHRFTYANDSGTDAGTGLKRAYGPLITHEDHGTTQRKLPVFANYIRKTIQNVWIWQNTCTFSHKETLYNSI